MNYQKLSNITLWVLLLLGVLVAVLFFFTGNEEQGYEVAGDTLPVPKATGLMMAWNYILFGLSILTTIAFICMGFVSTLKSDKKAAMTQLCILVAFVLLFAVCWCLGSGDKINIIGYDGTDNQGFWANLADMMMYVSYALVAGTIGALIWGVCYTKIKK